MKKYSILLIVSLITFCIPQIASPWGNKEHTALVIDAETGKPIEGAIALAQWFRAVALGLGFGSSQALDKTVEAYSDKDGKVYIGGYWGLFSDTRLTVYKPGYVLWDSQVICPAGKRTDFDEKHRTVKLLKFEPEAARWIKENYCGGKKIGPRSMHMSFFSFCQRGGDKFQDIFRANELPLKDKEEFEQSQKLKKEFEKQQKLK